MRVKDRIGAFGEQCAVEHLERAGYVVVDRNWRCARGEIDIVALDGDTVVVCEVKTRSGPGFGSGLDAVNRAKIARLGRLARRWLEQSGQPGRPWRIDVVAVHRWGTGLHVEHVHGAS